MTVLLWRPLLKKFSFPRVSAEARELSLVTLVYVRTLNPSRQGQDRGL